MAINFVAPKTEESARLTRLKQLVSGVTTVILVGYVIVASGFLGWWGYLSRKEVKVSEESRELKSKIAAKSSEEVVLRKLGGRVAAVSGFLDGRVEVKGIAQTLEEGELIPGTWEYDAGTGRQSVTVNSAQVGSVERFVGYLAGRYPWVRLESVTWRQENLWTGTVSFSGSEGGNGTQ